MTITDLREEFETLLRRNITRRLDFVWNHIERQIRTSLKKGSNDVLDALKSAAAAHHAVPQTLTEAVIDRQRKTWDTYDFTTELLFRICVALLGLYEADHD